MKNPTVHAALTIVALAIASTQSHAQSPYEPYTFTTIAGYAGYGSADGTAGAARFHRPRGIAVDNAGNVYVADAGNYTIRKVTPAGPVTTVAGLAGNPGSADGTGTDARFSYPAGLAVDGASNVYVADNYLIRKITPVGTNWVVTTLAGLAESPRLPAGLAVDSAGNVYVADSGTYTIRKVNPAGMVTTLPGLPPYDIFGVAVDSADNVYVAELSNNTILKFMPVGTNWVVTTQAGMGTDARLNSPSGVTVDSAGNVYVADTWNHTIGKVTPVGTNWVLTTLVGSAGRSGFADGIGKDARFDLPEGVAVDNAGSVYVADSGNSTIRKITPVGTNWVVTTPAGLAGSSGGTDGSGITSRFSGPSRVALDSVGNVYVADTGNATIRKMTPVENDWVVTTLAGKEPYYDSEGNYTVSEGSTDGTGSEARFYGPSGVAVDDAGNVYVADANNGTIRKVTPAGVVTTLAGLAGSFGSADGVGREGRFGAIPGNSQMDIAVGNEGNVYVADIGNATIRKMTPVGTNWVVTTLAGLAGSFGTADGIGSDARFGNIHGTHLGIAVDITGNVYVADYSNYSVRKITPQRVVTTLGNFGGAPTCIALDRAGNVYVAISDFMSIPPYEAIQKMSPEGTVTTLAGVFRVPGLSVAFGSADGTGRNARFHDPLGLAVDNAGNIYVADSGNNTIRRGSPPTMIVAVGQRFDSEDPTTGEISLNFSLNFSGPAGGSLIVEASSDLLSWLPISTNTFAGFLEFNESQRGLSSHRFYRAYSK